MKAVILIGPLVDEYEVVVPYALFKAHGFEVDVASFEAENQSQEREDSN